MFLFCYSFGVFLGTLLPLWLGGLLEAFACCAVCDVFAFILGFPRGMATCAEHGEVIFPCGGSCVLLLLLGMKLPCSFLTKEQLYPTATFSCTVRVGTLLVTAELLTALGGGTFCFLFKTPLLFNAYHNTECSWLNRHWYLVSIFQMCDFFRFETTVVVYFFPWFCASALS